MHGLINIKWLGFVLLTVAICCIAVVEVQAAPTAVINGIPPEPTNATSATITVTGEDVVSYKYRLDGGVYSAEIPSTIQIKFTYLGDGFHTLYVIGKDSLGDWQETATSATWAIDTVAPDTSINAARPANPSSEKTGRFSFASTEAGSIFECSLDSVIYVACISPYTFTALSDGRHTFTVRSTDKADNTDQSPASFTWTIDTTAPDTAIIGNPSNPTRETTGNFTFSSNETASFECSLDDGSFTGCVTPYAVFSLPEGSHTLKVRAVDKAGNIDPSEARYSWSIDTTPPLLSISSLSNGYVTSNEILNISGATDNINVSLAINGKAVTLNTDLTFSHAIVLQAGANVITTSATDPAGNKTTDTRTVFLDQSAPTLDIFTPSDNSVTAKSSVAISGKVNETSDVEITIENSSGTSVEAILASVTAEFDSMINLAAGINTIQISATDHLGNKTPTAQKITVTFDDQKPSVAITEPGNDIRVTKDRIVIKGTVSDALSEVIITLSMDGETFAPSIIDNGFSQEIKFIEEKIYHISAKATDLAGNMSIASRNIVFSGRPAIGDINNDGIVDLVDAMRALKISTGLVMQTDEDLIFGDIAPLISGIPAPDGIIDVGDAVIILKIITNLVSLS